MTDIEWVRGEDGSKGISWNALRAMRNAKLGGAMVPRRVSANHCEHVNEACRNCYAGDLNPRHGGLAYKRQNRDQYEFVCDEAKLLAPARRRKPTRIFVESMSDAFGEWWPREFVDKLYAVQALTPQHTYINLTKRPERRREYLADDDAPKRIAEQASGLWTKLIKQRSKAPPLGNVRIEFQKDEEGFGGVDAHLDAWPLPNAIEGTSVSCQEEADAFVPELMATNCAIRAVSAEPLLGPIDFARWMLCETPLDWIIVGGESGRKARPMHPDWARDIRDQCEAADVAFFFKQWGEYGPAERRPGSHAMPAVQINGDYVLGMGRLGKKRAGRLLDGRTHDGFPVLSSPAKD